MEVYAEKVGNEFNKLLDDNEEQLKSLLKAEATELSTVISQQEAWKEAMVEKLKTVEKVVGSKEDEITKKQKQHSEKKNLDVLRNNALQLQKKKLKETSEQTEKSFQELQLKGKTSKKIRQGLLQFQSTLFKKLQEVQQEEEKETETQTQTSSFWETCCTETQTMRKYSLDAVKLSVALECELQKMNNKDLDSLLPSLQPLRECIKKLDQQSNLVEKKWKECPNLEKIQQKWQQISNRFTPILEWIDKHESECKLIELQVDDFLQCCSRNSNLTQQTYKQVLKLVNLCWKIWGNCNAITRAKRSRQDRLQTINESIEHQKRVYGQQLEIIKQNMKRFCQKSTSYLNHATDSSGETTAIPKNTGFEGGLDHLGSVWSIKFTA